MEDLIVKIFTVYGPLGLGWVAWFFTEMENRKTAQRYIELSATTISTLAALKVVLDERLPSAESLTRLKLLIEGLTRK